MIVLHDPCFMPRNMGCAVLCGAVAMMKKRGRHVGWDMRPRRRCADDPIDPTCLQKGMPGCVLR